MADEEDKKNDDSNGTITALLFIGMLLISFSIGVLISWAWGVLFTGVFLMVLGVLAIIAKGLADD